MNGSDVFRAELIEAIEKVENLLAMASDETKASVTWNDCGECRMCGTLRWPNG